MIRKQKDGESRHVKGAVECLAADVMAKNEAFRGSVTDLLVGVDGECDAMSSSASAAEAVRLESQCEDVSAVRLQPLVA